MSRGKLGSIHIQMLRSTFRFLEIETLELISVLLQSLNWIVFLEQNHNSATNKYFYMIKKWKIVNYFQRRKKTFFVSIF